MSLIGGVGWGRDRARWLAKKNASASSHGDRLLARCRGCPHSEFTISVAQCSASALPTQRRRRRPLRAVQTVMRSRLSSRKLQRKCWPARQVNSRWRCSPAAAAAAACSNLPPLPAHQPVAPSCMQGVPTGAQERIFVSPSLSLIKARCAAAGARQHRLLAHQADSGRGLLACSRPLRQPPPRLCLLAGSGEQQPGGDAAVGRTCGLQRCDCWRV